MKIKFSLAVLALVLTLATVACKKKADEVSAPLDSNTGLAQTGSFIKGTIVTKTNNGVDQDWAFEQTYQDNVMYFDGTPSGNFRSSYFYNDFTGYAGDNGKYSRIQFDLDTITDTTPDNIDITVYSRKALTTGSDFYFSFYGDAGNTVITNYSYDAVNKTMSGNFAVTGTTNTDNGQEANITGSFLFTNLRQRVR
jgi:hypothetical protein